MKEKTKGEREGRVKKEERPSSFLGVSPLSKHSS